MTNPVLPSEGVASCVLVGRSKGKTSLVSDPPHQDLLPVSSAHEVYLLDAPILFPSEPLELL